MWDPSLNHVMSHDSPLSQNPYALLPLLILILLLPSSYYVYRDYQAFLSLGPGGTPATIHGYLRVKFLSLFKLKDPYKPPAVPQTTRPQTGYLTSLPKRGGQRPAVEGIAPHRQVTQQGNQADYSALAETISSLAQVPANQLVLGTSCFEKHGTGLFSVAPVTRTCKGEICHAHPSDGSLHMTLHPADVALVLERGWGEKHPLARGGWLSRFVPANFAMVYAPRNQFELEVVTEIICAAAWWVGGRAISKKEKDHEQGEMGEEPVSFCRCCEDMQKMHYRMPGIVQGS